MKIVTHNSRFHSDDVFGVATLLKVFPGSTVTRTRDMDVITSADIVLDVGGIYDPELLRFDHHQEGGAGVRDNGVPYASFGLIWKKFGEQVCGSKDLADFLERKLVQPIDFIDAKGNLLDFCKPTVDDLLPYIIQNITFAYNPTWKEDTALTDEYFMKMVDFAGHILEREILQAQHQEEAKKYVIEAYNKAENKKIIILDGNYPYETIINEYKEPLFVVKPNIQNNTWKVECVRDDLFSYKNRKQLPQAWAGKRDAELAKISGVEDAVFCHNSLFIAVAKSKEGALKLAKIAVES